MENMVNFKRMEVSGATKEEALALASFGIQGDATAAYRKAREKHTGVWSDNDMKEFMASQLASKTKNLPGVGLYITLESAVKDTRKRNYTITPIKNDKGPRRDGKVYQIIDDETNAVLAETKCKLVPQVDESGKPIEDEEGNVRMRVSSETITDAKELVKNLYAKGYKGNCHCRYTKQVVEGLDTVFTAEYTPSKGSRPGRYLVFGVEAI